MSLQDQLYNRWNLLQRQPEPGTPGAPEEPEEEKEERGIIGRPICISIENSVFHRFCDSRQMN